MQRHKSVEKRDRQNKKANIVNRAGKSRISTASKKVLAAKDASAVEEALKEAYSVLDKSVKSGLIHKKKAANRKSSLSKAAAKAVAK
ncbi:MAG: 30S ribosomal protein S20 [Chitinispirillaceae bacterium]|nr:30S ribosomal protein S20 [Chitinispirillaceae bacterium]